MEDNYQQRSYHGLSTQNYASRSLSSISEPTGPPSLDTTSSMHYQASMSMADPLAVWQHMPSRQSGAAAISMMGSSQQNNAAALMMLQSQGLSYYPSPVKIFSPTMQQQSQNAQFYHASLASSKRFSEEEKHKLEKVFTDETQKPSTSRKRQLAEELGCPVPKVNNWFQNRRAREKQMHRVQAYEASQAADRAAGGPDTPTATVDEDDEDDENEDATESESDSTGSHNELLHSSTKTISETDDSSPGQGGPTPESSNGRGNGSMTESPAASPHGIIKTEDEYLESHRALETERQRCHPQLPHLDVSLGDTVFNSQQSMLSSSPDAFEATQHESSFQTLQHQFAAGYASLGDMSGLGVFVGDDRHTDFYPTSASFMSQRTPTITTSIAEHEEEMEGHHDEASIYSSYGSLSPDMIPNASPNMDQTHSARITDSSHTSIASRRKIRPPQRLNQTALRDFQNGPKTGIEDTRRTDMYRTMRRAASANGPLSGKIFKSAPPLSPRSPRTFGPNLLEQLSRQSSLSAAAGQSSSSPIGPTLEQRYLSAGKSGLGLQHRSSSLSLNSYAEKMSLSPSSEYTREASSLNRAHNLSMLHFQNSKFAHDTGCGNVSPDGPLATPSLSQFGSELDFSSSLSAPRYVESEPTTPSYVPVTMAASTAAAAAAAAAHHGFQTLKIEPTPQANSFPWSRSPDHFGMWNMPSMHHFGEPQTQTFQFQPNVTPSNFQSPA